jgi:hypothetical protein
VAGDSADATLALLETALGDAEPLVPPAGTQVLRAFRLSSRTLAFVRLVGGFAVVDVIVPGADQAVAAAARELEPIADGPVETAARPVSGEVLALSVVDETPAAYELATVMINVVQATASSVVAREDWPVILSHGVDFGARTRDLFWPGPLDALAGQGLRLALHDDVLSVELWRAGGDTSSIASGAVTPVYLAGRATVQFAKAALATPASVWRELGLTPLPPAEVDTEALGWMFGANQGAIPRLVARLALGLAEAVPEPVRAAVAASGEAESIVLPFDRPGEALSAFGVVLLPGAPDEAANALLLCFEQGVAPPYCPGGQLEIDEEPRRLAAGDSAAHLRGWSYRLAHVDDRAIVWLEAPGVRVETAGTRLGAAGLDDVVGLVSVDIGPLASSDSEGDRLLAGQLSGVAGRDRLDVLLEPGSEGLIWQLPYRPGERTQVAAQRPQFVPALELVQNLPLEVPGPCARFADTDGDARLDEIAHHTYDSAGRLVVTEVDRDLDGEADRRIQYWYPTTDADAQVSFEVRDLDGDGRGDESVRRQFDAEGRLLAELTMGSGDGWAVLRTFERNDEDGSVNVYERYAPAGGQLDEPRLVDVRPPPGGSVPWQVEETDASGRVTARHVELSGGMTQTTRYAYDAAGNLLSEIATQTGYRSERPVSHHRLDYGCWRLDADGRLLLPESPVASAHRSYDLLSVLEYTTFFPESETPEGPGDALSPSRVEPASHPEVAIELGGPRVEGDLSRQVVQRVFRLFRSRLLSCYERQEGLVREGRVGLTLSIDTDGSVTAVVLDENELEDDGLATCITETVERMRFPATESGATVRTILVFVRD